MAVVAAAAASADVYGRLSHTHTPLIIYNDLKVGDTAAD